MSKWQGGCDGNQPPTDHQLCRRAGRQVYLSGVTPDPGGDITSQTAQVLARIDDLLAKTGTDKSKLLTAQV